METERSFNVRMQQLEALAAAQGNDEAGSLGEEYSSQEAIRNQIKNSNENDKLNFTQGLMQFAPKIEKRFLVDGIIFSLEMLATESAKIKIALLDQFIPLIQLI